MKRLFRNVFAGLAAAMLALIVSAPPYAQAQPAYPVNSPVYIPNAVLAPSTLTATGEYYFNTVGVAGASVRVSALSGTLVAAVQASNDALTVANASATWTTISYLNATSPSTAPAQSISANGLYIFNTAGFSRFRVHVTTLSGGSHTVTLQAVASPGPNVVYVGNPGQSATSAPPITQTLPVSATVISASTTGTTAATTATLTPSSGKTIFLCGFSIRANATSAATGNATITGLGSGTLNFTQFTAPLASGIGVIESPVGSQCTAASGADQAVAVISAAPGTGGTVSVSAWGYQK